MLNNLTGHHALLTGSYELLLETSRRALVYVHFAEL